MLWDHFIPILWSTPFFLLVRRRVIISEGLKKRYNDNEMMNPPRRWLVSLWNHLNLLLFCVNEHRKMLSSWELFDDVSSKFDKTTNREKCDSFGVSVWCRRHSSSFTSWFGSVLSRDHETDVEIWCWICSSLRMFVCCACFDVHRLDFYRQ